MKKMIIALLLTLATMLICLSAVVSAQVEQDASTQPETKWKKVECSWELIQKYFSRYYKFFPELYWEWGSDGWTHLEGKYKCKNVLQFIIKEEGTRWRRNVVQSHPGKGIDKGIFIAYGKLISPPYNLKTIEKEQSLIINDVPVWPRFGPNPVKKSKFQLCDDEIIKMGNIIEDTLKAKKKLEHDTFTKYLHYLVKTYGKREGITKFKNYMKGLVYPGKMIADFKFFDEDKMIFDFKFSIDDHWDVPLKYQLTDEQWDIYKDDPVYSMSDEEARKYIESQKRIASIAKIKDLKSEIEEALLADKIVLLGAIEDYYILTPEQYAEIVKILKRSNLDTLSKLEAVNSVVSQVADETDSTLISLILVFNNSFD